jgi:hypothetical protein
MLDTQPTNGLATSADPKPLTSAQRALKAARLKPQFTPDAKKRQESGVRVLNGTKGKSAAKAATQFNVSPRAVELAITVLKHGVREVVELLSQGRLSIRAAVKLATLYPINPCVQQRVVEEIAAGRPLAEALAAAGVQKRKPRSFDDKALTKAVTRLRKVLDQRAAAFGPCEAYWQARDRLGLVSKAVCRWRSGGYNARLRKVIDAYGRPARESVARDFQIVEQIEIVCGQFDGLAKQVQGLTYRPGSQLIQSQLVLCRIKEACKILSDARPVHVCSFCSGPTCEHCRGLGWTPVPDWKPAEVSDEPESIELPSEAVPRLVPDALPAPVRVEAPAPKPMPPKRLCHRCWQHGYPCCSDCTLAFDPELERGKDGCLYRVRCVPKPDGVVFSWIRCAVCNDPYQSVGPPFRNPPRCNNCLADG